MISSEQVRKQVELEKELQGMIAVVEEAARNPPPPPPQKETHTKTTQTEEQKPTYANVAAQTVTPVAPTPTNTFRKDMDWSPYEDLSEYEKEGDEVAPPPPKKESKRTELARTPSTTMLKAVIVHGIPCQRPMAGTIQDVGVYWNVIGARWLVNGQRRAGKATSSVVVFFQRGITSREKRLRMKIRGRWHRERI